MSFYHNRPVWERLSCPTKACCFSIHLYLPAPSLGTTDVKAILNYTVDVLFTSDAKLRRLVMGKRCICLQGTKGQEKQKIKLMHGNLVPSPPSLLLRLCRAQVQENETVKLKVEVLIILAFIWNHAGKLALSICCTFGLRMIGQMLGIQE